MKIALEAARERRKGQVGKSQDNQARSGSALHESAVSRGKNICVDSEHISESQTPGFIRD